MKEDHPSDWFYYVTLVTQLGLVVVATILAGFFVGLAIDKKAGTSPVFMALATVLGIAAGLWNAYQLIMRKMK
ncbi:MAG: AtpZ/AtpI family protein [Candidatus Omnitrophica bacterium]|nr:AtpZ/AtpI family protein [Candidatus Omnitrophota bacterium]